MKHCQTTWDLSLLYKSIDDPQIERDVAAIEAACARIARRYKSKKFIETPAALFEALEYTEKVSSAIAESKPLLYLFLTTEIDTENNAARAKLQLFEERLTKAGNQLVFFDLAIAAVPKKVQKAFLLYVPLKKYRYMLEKIFASAAHLLSEKEEQLLSLLAQPSVSMWVDATSKFLSQQTVLYKGKQIPLSEAEQLLSTLPKKERHELYQCIVSVLKSATPLAEAEINAIVTQKKITNTLRKHATVTSEALLAHELDKKTVGALTDAVAAYLPIVRQFYTLHAALLGEQKLSYADRQVPVAQVSQRFDFDTTVTLVKEAFAQAGVLYPQVLDEFLTNGQIDVFPRGKKKGGGYCLNSIGNPTFVLLNHTDDFHSAETLAHEMGHAYHSLFTKEQPEHYQHYTMSTAEVASTFFEQLFSEHVAKILSPQDAIAYLHGKILRDITTIFRQVAFFNFETALHESVQKNGYHSSLEIQQLLVQHLSSYLGGAFELTDDDGLQYTDWPHLRMMFYTISYAYGLLVSKGLYSKWKENPAFMKKVEQFMRAGGSAAPKDIFKACGIDTTDRAFFITGLESIAHDIRALKRLAKREGLI